MADSNGAPLSQTSPSTLQMAYCRALELAHFKGGFLARTAHELRSPLNKAISLQQMILEGLCDDIAEEREFVAEAQAASMKLLEYLDFLIRISKIETGRMAPDFQAVSLAETFIHVKEMTYLQARDRNLRLIVEPPDPTLQVWADPTWLRNILTTLIDIAVDSCDRGTIRLALAPDSAPDVYCLWLEDDRPAECWQEPMAFPLLADFDLDDTLSSTLRMSMVEAMVEAMNGTLTLLAAPQPEGGASSRLALQLPRSAS